ncbi:MAG: hypothetical protein SV253_10315 [Halobacteria archaeon]|nr:hypothetical protein [Halobacteria archaeon]
MAEVRIQNPDIHEEKTADGKGRVYLGKDYENRKVRIVVEVVDDEPEE